MSRARQALSGVRWGALGLLFNTAAQLGLMACMARLLTPADFGLMALALAALNLLAYASQSGLAPALVQRPELDVPTQRLAWTLALLLSLACAALTALLAPLVALWAGQASLAAVLQLLALQLPLNAMALVATALLRRRLRFKALAVVDAASYVLGYGLAGLAGAWAGWGVWALVAAQLGQALLQAGLSLALARPDCRLSLQGDWRGLLGYGGRHALIGLIELVGGNADTALIGRSLGDASLGLYSRARLLAQLPTEKLAGIVGRVLFPLLASTQTDRARVGEVLGLGALLIGGLGAALSLGVSATAQPLVLLLLGPQWQAAVPLLQGLALAVPWIFMSNVAGITCDALGWLGPKLRLQAALTLLLCLGLVLLVGQGLRVLVGFLVMVEMLRWAAYLGWLRGPLQIRSGDLLRIHAAVLGSGLLVMLAVSGALALCPAASALLQVLVAVAAGSVGLSLAIVLALRGCRDTAALQLAQRHWPWLLRWTGAKEVAHG